MGFATDRFRRADYDAIHPALTDGVILLPSSRGNSKGRKRMVNVVRGSVIAMLVALTIGAVVAYFTPAGSASGEGYSSATQQRE